MFFLAFGYLHAVEDKSWCCEFGLEEVVLSVFDASLRSL
jgi:hypothetical protein